MFPNKSSKVVAIPAGYVHKYRAVIRMLPCYFAEHVKVDILGAKTCLKTYRSHSFVRRSPFRVAYQGGRICGNYACAPLP